MREFSSAESRIVNMIQRGIPLCHEPFKKIAESFSITEKEVMHTISSLRDEGIVRDISAIFSASKLGYSMSLVAFKLAEADVEHAASIVNSHPGVSHNYVRDHDFNMWFTLALPPGLDLDAVVARIAGACHAADYFIPRNERLFKIGMVLSVGDDESGPSIGLNHTVNTDRTVVDEKIREAVRLLQVNLPVVERPFAEIVRQAGSSMTEDELLDAGRSLLASGTIRRYAAVLRHRNAGYMANAMTAWRPAEGRDIESLARPFEESGAVTHLYLRSVYPGRWEHPLFAMIHARNEEELKTIITDLAEKSGMNDYLVLRSVRELKKRRVRYFSPEFDTWEINDHD